MTSPAARQRDAAATIAAALLAAELLAAALLPRGAQAIVRVVGAACGFLALPMLFLPMVTLRKHGRVPPGSDYMQTTVVVERGLFAVVRHPQYTGYLLLAVTFACLSQHLATVLLGVAGAIALVYWTLAEDRDLRARFGTAYEDYRRRVPMFNVVAGTLRYVRGPTQHT